ncbi:MAG: hypothetical protein NC485_13325 [Ruminococcus flavefaciens]|nr:hypothetical protein [Ruminococcus flavefaciens]
MIFFEKYKLPLFIILICVCLLELCIIIYGVNEELIISLWSQNLFSIITAIICSVLASAIMLFLPNTTSKDVDKNVALKDISEIVKETLKDLPDGKFPILYEDTNDPNVNFNDRLNRGIQSTKKFIYFGDRALYLTKRLGKEIIYHDSRLEINVFVADIREDSIFRSRERMYLKKERSNYQNTKNQKSIDEIIINEKMEVLRSLYALGKLSEKYEIHVYLHKEIPFIRFELTDSLMVMTFLTQWTSGKKYPATLMFENNDLFNINFVDYSEQLKKRSMNITTDNLTVDKLRKLAKSAGLPNFKDEEITKYYEEHVK